MLMRLRCSYFWANIWYSIEECNTNYLLTSICSCGDCVIKFMYDTRSCPHHLPRRDRWRGTNEIGHAYDLRTIQWQRHANRAPYNCGTLSLSNAASEIWDVDHCTKGVPTVPVCTEGLLSSGFLKVQGTTYPWYSRYDDSYIYKYRSSDSVRAPIQVLSHKLLLAWFARWGIQICLRSPMLEGTCLVQSSAAGPAGSVYDTLDMVPILS